MIIAFRRGPFITIEFHSSNRIIPKPFEITLPALQARAAVDEECGVLDVSADVRVQAARLRKLVDRQQQRWTFVFDDAQELEKQEAWRPRTEPFRFHFTSVLDLGNGAVSPICEKDAISFEMWACASVAFCFELE